MKTTISCLYEHVNTKHQLTVGKMLLKRLWKVEIIIVKQSY